MKKNLFLFGLLTFLLADTVYSFIQHFNVPLDGDLTGVVLPDPVYHHLWSDPFGWHTISTGEHPITPNRFFAHFATWGWFRSVPFFLQRFISPIDSLYATAALAKTLIQVLILILLATGINIHLTSTKKSFLFAAVLVAPLFQTSIFSGIMGIIDQSVTYTFAYALPLSALLLLYLPFFRWANGGNPPLKTITAQLSWLALATMLAFSGPLMPGLNLILFLLLTANLLWSTDTSMLRFDKIWKAVFRREVLLLLIFAGLCLYSFFLGTYDPQTPVNGPTVLQRYRLLFIGLSKMLTLKVGLSLLIAGILATASFHWKNRQDPESKKVLTALRWTGIFTLLYLLLLPLGGYRAYRPYIVRSDTMGPVLLCLFYCWGLSAMVLLRSNRLKRPWVVYAGTMLFLLFFTIADKPEIGKNACERRALETLSESVSDTVRLNADCRVLSWETTSPKSLYDNNAEMLAFWGVTKGKKKYYQK